MVFENRRVARKVILFFYPYLTLKLYELVTL